MSSADYQSIVSLANTYQTTLQEITLSFGGDSSRIICTSNDRFIRDSTLLHLGRRHSTSPGEHQIVGSVVFKLFLLPIINRRQEGDKEQKSKQSARMNLLQQPELTLLPTSWLLPPSTDTTWLLSVQLSFEPLAITTPRSIDVYLEPRLSSSSYIQSSQCSWFCPRLCLNLSPDDYLQPTSAGHCLIALTSCNLLALAMNHRDAVNRSIGISIDVVVDSRSSGSYENTSLGEHRITVVDQLVFSLDSLSRSVATEHVRLPAYVLPVLPIAKRCFHFTSTPPNNYLEKSIQIMTGLDLLLLGGGGDARDSFHWISSGLFRGLGLLLKQSMWGGVYAESIFISVRILIDSTEISHASSLILTSSPKSSPILLELFATKMQHYHQTLQSVRSELMHPQPHSSSNNLIDSLLTEIELVASSLAAFIEQSLRRSIPDCLEFFQIKSSSDFVGCDSLLGLADRVADWRLLVTQARTRSVIDDLENFREGHQPLVEGHLLSSTRSTSEDALVGFLSPSLNSPSLT